VLPGAPEQVRPIGMEFATQAELLAEELAQPEPDHVFYEALEFAAPLVVVERGKHG